MWYQVVSGNRVYLVPMMMVTSTSTASTLPSSLYWNGSILATPDPFYRQYWERQRQEAALKSHRKQVQDRATDLLLAHLSPEQRETFKQNGWFIVKGESGLYRVNAKRSLIANIDVLDGERVTHRLCAHADVTRYPEADNLLAQKLMLEGAEKEFLRIANRHAA